MKAAWRPLASTLDLQRSTAAAVTAPEEGTGWAQVHTEPLSHRLTSSAAAVTAAYTAESLARAGVFSSMSPPSLPSLPPLLLLLLTSSAQRTIGTAAAYRQLTKTCGHAQPIGGNHPVATVAQCEQRWVAQAAGTGQPAFRGVDTDSSSYYLKSECDGTPSKCSAKMCGYRTTRPAPAPAPPALPVPPSPPGVTLRDAGKMHGVFIGAATQAGDLKNTPQYKSTAATQFSLTTAENACKFGPIHPQRNSYNWQACDTVFADAEKAGQAVRGHNLYRCSTFTLYTENPR